MSCWGSTSVEARHGDESLVTPITFGPQTAQAAQVQVGKAALALPCDTMRAQYASAVEHGLIERSMLALGKFERAVGALEQLAVGPLARSV